mmetsp:Transcript_46974/g.111459  ORF Transcript_46974/g.111459 Transcript_46974/m.111459 type:complete len:274 (+) Transcript_46974:449-1270(+)
MPIDADAAGAESARLSSSMLASENSSDESSTFSSSFSGIGGTPWRAFAMSSWSCSSFACSRCTRVTAEPSCSCILLARRRTSSSFSFIQSGVSTCFLGVPMPMPLLIASVAWSAKPLAAAAGLAMSGLTPSASVRPMSWAELIACFISAGSCIICISSGFAIIFCARLWNLGLDMTAKRFPLDASSSFIMSSIAPGSCSRASAIFSNIGLPFRAAPTLSSMMSSLGLSVWSGTFILLTLKMLSSSLARSAGSLDSSDSMNAVCDIASWRLMSS